MIVSRGSDNMEPYGIMKILYFVFNVNSLCGVV
jgi:hypothetical protein